jgi:predicted dehydrogenase
MEHLPFGVCDRAWGSVVGESPRGVILVGLGPYARRTYYPLLQRYAQRGVVRIAAVVDQESQRAAVEEYLAVQRIQPATTFFVRDGERGSDLLAARLDPAILGGSPRPWGCIVSTEPRYHLWYTQWALRHRLRVLLEKPISAVDLGRARPRDAGALVEDYARIAELSRECGVPVIVQSQRRAHQAYVDIKATARELVEQFGVPMTYLDIYHADGTWNMPWEFVSRENHPYRYGYGKLLHSGYHFIDLLCWLSEANAAALSVPDEMRIAAHPVGLADVEGQLPPAAYERLFGPAAWAPRRELPAPADLAPQRWGETDVVLLAKFLSERRCLTTAVLSLLQTSFSRRSWLDLPRDTYKGNGRVRHERLTVQIGPLATIQAHSYQDGESADGGGAFDISVYRNAKLIGGSAAEHRRYTSAGSGSAAPDSLNFAAREELFKDFLRGDSNRSGIEHHALTVRALAAAVREVLRPARSLAGGPAIRLDQRTAVGPENRHDQRRRE